MHVRRPIAAILTTLSALAPPPAHPASAGAESPADAAMAAAAASPRASSTAWSTAPAAPEGGAERATVYASGTPTGEAAEDIPREPAPPQAADQPPADPHACASLPDDAPGEEAGSVLRFAERLGACGHDELAESILRDLLARPGLPRTQRLAAMSGLAAALSRQERGAEAEQVYRAILQQELRGSVDVPVPAAEPATDPAATRARRQAAGIDRRPAPYVSPSVQRSLRPDGTGLSVRSAEERWVSPDGSGSVAARLEESRYDTQDPAVGARNARPTVRLQQGIGRDLELRGGLAADLLESPGAATAATGWAYDAGLKYRQSDRLQLDLGSTRTAPTDPLRQQVGLPQTTTSASLALVPEPGRRHGLRVDRSLAADGLLRSSTRLESEYRLGWLPSVWLGGRLTSQDEIRPGEAAARGQQTRMLTVRYATPGLAGNARFGYGVTLGVGESLLDRQPEGPVVDLSVRGVYRLLPGTTLEASVQSLRSGGASAATVSRTAAGLNLRHTW